MISVMNFWASIQYWNFSIIANKHGSNYNSYNNNHCRYHTFVQKKLYLKMGYDIFGMMNYMKLDR